MLENIIMTYWPMKSAGYFGYHLKDNGKISLKRLLDNTNTFKEYKNISLEEKSKFPMIQGIDFGERLIKNEDNGQKSGDYLKLNKEYNAYLHWNGFYACDVDVDKEKTELTEQHLINLYNSLKQFVWFVACCRSTGGKGIHIYTLVKPIMDRNSLKSCEWCYISNAKRINKIIKYYLEKNNIQGWTDNAMCQIGQGIHVSGFYKYVNDRYNFIEKYIPPVMSRTYRLISAYKCKNNNNNENKINAIPVKLNTSMQLHSPKTWQLAQTIGWWFENANDFYEFFVSQCSTPYHYKHEWIKGLENPMQFNWCTEWLMSLGYKLKKNDNYKNNILRPKDIMNKYIK